METIILIYYTQEGELLHRLINIFDDLNAGRAQKHNLEGIKPEIVQLLSSKSNKIRIQLLTENDCVRVLNKSKSAKVERIPAILKVLSGKIVKVVYLTDIDEFDVAIAL